MGYEGKHLKNYKRDKLRSLGAKDGKGQKMPYPLLMELKKKWKEREKTETAQTVGFSRDVKSRDPVKDKINQLLGNRRGDKGTVGDGSRGFRPHVGKFKDGMLVLSKNDINRIQANDNFNESRPSKKHADKGSGKGKRNGKGKKKSKAR
eukprot:TRINITY_DN1837_c0_g1_i17.p1 TRINITY_DN1837_c0_g1~~TRINITY_DN1837_c0_g1_i17.p1  ORF type:complete len:149 (-),score=30.08 TRINITY_DN1837_c0_g1_i17:108-554(-)